MSFAVAILSALTSYSIEQNLAKLTTLSLVALCLVLAIKYFKLRSERFKHRDHLLSLLPSPGGRLPLVGHIHQLFSGSKVGEGGKLSARIFAATNRWAEQFKDVGLFHVRFGPQPIVYVFSPEAVEAVLSARFLWYKFTGMRPLLSWLETGLLVRGGPAWHADRKLLTSSFHFQILEQFNPIVNKHARTLCRVIGDKEAVDGAVQIEDMAEVASAVTLDSICETSFGQDMKLLSKGNNVYSSNFSLYTEILIRRSFTVILQNETLFKLTPDGRRQNEAVDNLKKFTMDIVQKRKEQLSRASDESDMNNNDELVEAKRPKSLLDRMLDIHMTNEANEGAKESLSLKEIRSQLDNFAFAGHDTSTVALTFALLEIAANKDVQSKLQKEIDEVVTETGDGLEVSSEQLKRLSYLDMVIKETLRMYPPAVFIGRYVNKDLEVPLMGSDLEPSERKTVTIPKGADIWINMKALHEDERWFPKPKMFDPERFTPENRRGRHAFAFVPFSAGIRNCIGQRYAMNSLKIILAHLIKNFEVEPVTRPEDVTLTFELTLRTTSPISLRFRRRK